MRILVAPDKFAGTLSAVEAAEAIATGWRTAAPDDEIDLAPMSDGGPGFVDVLHAALGGELLVVPVSGPFGEPIPATVLLVGDTAYVESAQACGLHLTGGERAEARGDRRRRRAGRRGDRRGCPHRRRRARRQRHQRRRRRDAGRAGRHGRRTPGPAAALGVDGVRHGRPRARAGAASATIRLVAATDVDSPLTGLFGATRTFGPQKGIAEERMPLVDGWLEEFAAAPTAGSRWRRAPARPAGSASGCSSSAPSGEPGIDAGRRGRRARRPRRGRRTWSSPARAPSTSAAGPARCRTASPPVAAEALRPCVALAGQVLVGSREMRALGMESAYSLVDLVGEERAFADPAGALALLAQRVARTWSR